MTFTVVQRFRSKNADIVSSSNIGARYGFYALEDIRIDEHIPCYTGELINDSKQKDQASSTFPPDFRVKPRRYHHWRQAAL